MHKLFNTLTILIFASVIIVPGIQMLTQPPLAESVSENRVLTQPPDIDLGSFNDPEALTESIEAYIGDQFGYRERLIYWHSYWQAIYLKQSPVERTIIGENDWLFLNSNDMMDDYRGMIEMSEQELEGWREYFGARQEWSEQRGIVYIVVIAPEKQTIYSEYLPDEYTLVVDGNTRLDQLLTAVSDEINMLDLRSTLVDAKRDAQIYRKVDTHWTGYGAFLAYQQIMEILRRTYPNIYVLGEDQLSTVQRTMQGDLSNAMGVGEVLKESLEDTVLRRGRACAEELERETLEGSRRALWIRMACPSRRLKLAMFRDSYSNALVPYIAESFRESLYVWDNMSFSLYGELLEDFQPDVVIEQFAERHISASEDWFNPPN